MPRKRRGRGEGSIFKRADGTWVGSLSAGYDAKGKRRRRTVYGKAKAEVQEKLRVASTEIANGAPIKTCRLTVADHLVRWLDVVKRPKVEYSTVVRYRSILDNHLIPLVGSVKLDKLKLVHVEQLFADMERRGASGRNRQLAGIVLSDSLKYAVRLGLIPFNPCRDAEKPKARHREMTVWQRDEVQQFLAATESDRLHAMYVLALTSGMRQGELFGFDWRDLDFSAGSLCVTRMLDETRGRMRLKPPKTGRGRKIELPQFTMDALHEHRKTMLAAGYTGGTVFVDRAGGWLRKSNVDRRSYKPAIARAGVPVIRFHDMRHTHATLLLQDGENVKVVSERLGHSSIKVTLDVYAHVLPSMQKETAKRLDRMFG